MSGECFECGNTPVESHHVVPRSLGGTRTIPLCSKCHGLVHSVKRNSISEMTKAALQAKRARGEYTGGYMPYGYTVTHDGKLIADEAEQRIIAYMRALAEGGVNCRQIARRLNTAGHRTKKGSSWYNVQVSRILAREAAYKTTTPEAQ